MCCWVRLDSIKLETSIAEFCDIFSPAPYFTENEPGKTEFWQLMTTNDVSVSELFPIAMEYKGQDFSMEQKALSVLFLWFPS